MAMRRLLLIIVFFFTPWAAPVYADFADGLAAYDAGDYAVAVEEWLPLARLGQTDAQLAIADLYLSGTGLQRSPAQAIAWFRRAAEQGDVIAQLNLGDFYRRGLGVRRDPVHAYFWLSLAADQGSRWSALQRQEIAETLTGEQRSAAEALLQNWQQKHPTQNQ